MILKTLWIRSLIVQNGLEIVQRRGIYGSRIYGSRIRKIRSGTQFSVTRYTDDNQATHPVRVRVRVRSSLRPFHLHTMTTSRLQVLAAYRRLFRARNRLFAGDTVALRESAIAIRQEFLRNARVAVADDRDVLQPLIAAAYEAEDMMLHGIVQGKLNPLSGNYEVKFSPEHAQAMPDLAVVEPITNETVSNLTENRPKPVKVEQTKAFEK